MLHTRLVLKVAAVE